MILCILSRVKTFRFSCERCEDLLTSTVRVFILVGNKGLMKSYKAGHGG